MGSNQNRSIRIYLWFFHLKTRFLSNLKPTKTVNFYVLFALRPPNHSSSNPKNMFFAMFFSLPTTNPALPKLRHGPLALQRAARGAPCGSAPDPRRLPPAGAADASGQGRPGVTRRKPGENQRKHQGNRGKREEQTGAIRRKRWKTLGRNIWQNTFFNACHAF